MQSIPLVRAFWGQPFLQVFREAGASVDEHLEEARLEADVDQSHEAVLPSRPLYGVLDRLARESGHRDVGLLVGERCRIQDLGSFGRRITSQKTLGDAIASARHLMPAVHTARSLELNTVGGVTRLSSRLDDTQLPLTTWDDQLTLSLLIDLMRLAAGPDWTPKVVTLQARPLEAPRPRGLLAEAEICYGACSTSIELPGSLLSRPLGPPPGHGFEETADRNPDVGLEALPTDFVGSLQLTLDSLVPQGYTDTGSLASFVGLSVRTLQRRLSENGCSFSELLARSRFTLARRRLVDPTARVIDVALATGYSDPAHFTKAFRRWTGGLTPVGYRTAQASARA